MSTIDRIDKVVSGARAAWTWRTIDEELAELVFDSAAELTGVRSEDTARQLGHHRLAIGVGVDNPSARRLYERLGYTDWGHGTVQTSWREHHDAGPPVTVTEIIHMLVRRL